MNMVLKIVLLQLISAGVVVYVLKLILDHELLLNALEHLEGFESAAGERAKEVTVLVGRVLSDKMTSRVRAVIDAKFPHANTSIVVSRDIGGGLVAQVDGKILDFSLAGRLEHLWVRRNG
jgi:F0F1-type ATP synthase delta subunit